MKTTIAAAGLALLAASGVFLQAEPRDMPRGGTDALADLRAALGGDAALNRVSTITMKGKVKRTGAMAYSGGVEISCALPDKFLRVAHLAHESNQRIPERRAEPYDPSEVPGRVSVLDVDYVRGDNRIEERRGLNGREPITSGRSGGQPSTNLGVSTALGRARRAFAAFVLPLMARAYDGYPMTPAAEGNTVTFRADDAMTFRLDLDPATHRPATLTWTDDPPMFPRGIVSSSVQNWVMTFTDYRAVSGGLMWPHRITTSAGGKRYEDVTVTSYAVNKTIKPNTFKTR